MLSALLLAAHQAIAAAPAPAPPSGFSGRLQLELEDYRRKNEGGYFTGLPLANYDSNAGFGFGARVYYYWNGPRSHPLFAYTPYLHRVFVQAFGTTGGFQFHWFDYDAPSIFNQPLRFRTQLIFMRNTEERYFGLGSRAMQPLSFSAAERRYRDFSAYQADLDRVKSDGTTHARYDRYDLIRPIALFGLEQSLFDGTMRGLFGFGFNYYDINDYSGEQVDATAPDGRRVPAPMASTRLAEDCAARRIEGCAGGWDNYLRLGLALDTRDFEPDPNHGYFVDAALDIGTQLLGSGYDYLRFMFSPRGYFDLLGTSADLILAVRGTLQLTSNVPFFGQKMIPYTEDPRTGLGGLRTLRGFKQDRFVGPVMTLLNTELRWTFTRFEVAQQKLALIAVPFVDLGAVFDRVSQLSLADWKRGQGLALRASWNLATILTAEYAFSSEDTGLYINFNHMF